jgi:hypothetical protein
MKTRFLAVSMTPDHQFIMRFILRLFAEGQLAYRERTVAVRSMRVQTAARALRLARTTALWRSRFVLALGVKRDQEPGRVTSFGSSIVAVCSRCLSRTRLVNGLPANGHSYCCVAPVTMASE